MQVAVLFARQDSIYKTMPECDVWDIERDARKWPGGAPVVAHPPCRSWGRLRQFAKPREGEKELALWAVEQVNRYGGVLEHPATSTLWQAIGAQPGKFITVDQWWWGHRAEKRTTLYCVGGEWGEIPFRMGRPTHCIRPTKSYPRLPSVTKAEREHTPPDFARWLVDLAQRCGGLTC